MRLAAAPTFRDLAASGVVTRDGRRLRSGLVYRAGHLFEPSEVELRFVRELNLGWVFDLRSERERLHQPSNWLVPGTHGKPPQAVNIDVHADVRAGQSALLHLLEAADSVEGARQMMLATYRAFPQAFARQLRPLFDAVLGAERDRPLLVHCTAGKDRTGFACALLLHALGVDERQLFEDYLRVGDVLVQTPLADGLGQFLAAALGRPLDARALAIIMGVDADFLATALMSLHQQFGSLEAYLEDALGVDEHARACLAERLLTD